jgi:membrane dipeptidase
MFIIDALLDLAWNALQWNRNVQESVYTIREQKGNLSGAGRGQGTVALPEMRQGHVAVCFATLLARSTRRIEPNIDYASPLQAYAAAQGQLAYYRALSELGEVRLIESIREVNNHITEWEKWESKTRIIQPPLGLIISMESADLILQPQQQLATWKKASKRPCSISLFQSAWTGTRRRRNTSNKVNIDK